MSLDAVGWGRGDNASEEALRQGTEVGVSLNTAGRGRGGKASEEVRRVGECGRRRCGT